MTFKTNTGAGMISLSAKVFHADGTVTDYGEVAYYNRNPFKRLWHSFLIRIKRWRLA